MRTDCMIAGIALDVGAARIVTGNVAEFERIVGGRIPVVEVPVVGEQMGIGDDVGHPN